MSTPVFWSVFGVAVVGVAALAYGVGWGLTGCHRWFLRCTCRTNLPGPVRQPAPSQLGHGRDSFGAGELHDEWERLDPDQAADQLIAEWHDDLGPIYDTQDPRFWTEANQRALERTRTGDVWDQWWNGVDGLERECLLVHDWLVREERLWAELKAETRELCAA